MTVKTSRRVPTEFEIGWSGIWGKKLGSILLLPNETSSVVVQLQPHFKISVLIPAKERNVTAKYNKYARGARPFQLETPDLVWTQQFGSEYILHSDAKADAQDCPCSYCTLKNNRKGRKLSSFCLYAVDLSTAKASYLMGSPYQIANVQRRGTICWGEIRIPESLKEAHLKFFGAPLNNSTNDHYIYSADADGEYIEKLKAYKPSMDWNLFSEIFGEKFISTDKPVTGIFISADESLADKTESLATFPYVDKKVTVGFATKDFSNGVWYVDFSENSMWLTENQVVIR